MDIGTQRSLDPLIEATRDSDAAVQIHATDGLVNFYLPGYVRTGLGAKLQRVGKGIKGKFTDTNDQVIEAYIQVRPEVIAALGKLARGGVSLESRANAARAIGILRGREAIPDLLEAMKSKDGAVIYESLIAIQKIRDKDVAPKLRYLLRDLDEKVQLAAIETNGILQNKEALPDLVDVLNRARSMKVRRAALTAIGGQPVVQPNGTVVVPIEDFSPQRIAAFMSTDGGNSWTNPVTVDRIQFHHVAGNLRTSPLPSAEIDGAGRVFVAWEDCAFEPGCSANDIVFSTSTDGTAWSSKARVPTNQIGSGADYFIPGIAVDPATYGSTAHVGLSYYYYPNANCGQPNKPACQLFSGFISSGDGGLTWGGTTTTSGPMDLTSLALTSQGYMVGDYESTSFSGGLAYPAIVFANAPRNSVFDEATYTVTGGFNPTATGAGLPAAASGASSTSNATGATTNR